MFSLIRQKLRARWQLWSLATFALLWLASHCRAIYTDSINWDEFALFFHASESVRTRVLVGAGQPGLATLLLMPLVRDCQDAMTVAHQARWITAVITVGIVLGLYKLLQALLRGLSTHADIDAVFGVALYACVPAVMRWSLQTRTDQGGLVCAMWAGVVFLASLERPYLASVAGLLGAIGCLFSHKAAYALALICVVAFGRQLLVRTFRLRREAARLLLVVSIASLVVAAFHLSTRVTFRPDLPSTDPTWDNYAFYRNVVGHKAYVGILTTLGPHIVLGLLLLGASVRTKEPALARQILLAWLLLGLGFAIGYIHPSAFSYFWMTLGLFPAVAGALALEPIRNLFSTKSVWRISFGALWAALLLRTIPTMLTMNEDTQSLQRDALLFVQKNFPKSAHGFHPEGALFCRMDSDPYPVYFAPHIAGRFRHAGADAKFIESFIARPVSFILASYRLTMFPPSVQLFWSQNYVLYGPGVFVPGYSFPQSGARVRKVTTTVPGRYRWIVKPRTVRLDVDGEVLNNEQLIVLSPGTHELRVLDPYQQGMLVYAFSSPPEPGFEFYSASMVSELDHGL